MNSYQPKRADTALAVVQSENDNVLMPAITIDEAIKRYEAIIKFTRAAMKEKIDYGVIPGTGPKKVLLKPGAEKLLTLFGLTASFTATARTEDWDNGFFYYVYRCELRRKDGSFAGDGEGSCNSKERKYQNQRQSAYDLVNTFQKMAQKRALIAAVLVAVNASEFFTQDLEDLEDESRQQQSQRTQHSQSQPQQYRKPAPQQQVIDGDAAPRATEGQKERINAWGQQSVQNKNAIVLWLNKNQLGYSKLTEHQAADMISDLEIPLIHPASEQDQAIDEMREALSE